MQVGFGGVNKKIGDLEELIKKEIEQLAISPAKGFKSVDKRFNEIDKRFDIVDTKIEGLGKRVDDLSENRVKYTWFNVLKKRVDVLEKKF